MNLEAANGVTSGTGNLTLNGNLNIGTGALTLYSGINGTRPELDGNGHQLGSCRFLHGADRYRGIQYPHPQPRYRHGGEQ